MSERKRAAKRAWLCTLRLINAFIKPRPQIVTYFLRYFLLLLADDDSPGEKPMAASAMSSVEDNEMEGQVRTPPAGFAAAIAVSSAPAVAGSATATGCTHLEFLLEVHRSDPILQQLTSDTHTTLLKLLRLPVPTSAFMLVQLNVAASPLDLEDAAGVSNRGRLGRFCSGSFVKGSLEVYTTEQRAGLRLGQPRGGSKCSVLTGFGGLQVFDVDEPHHHRSAVSELLLVVAEDDGPGHLVELLVPHGSTICDSHDRGARAVAVFARLLTGLPSQFLSREQRGELRSGLERAIADVRSRDAKRSGGLQRITPFFEPSREAQG